MNRSLRSSDILRQMLLGALPSPDLVYTRERVGEEPKGSVLLYLTWQLLSVRRKHAWAMVERQRLQGVAALRMRSGRGAWEVEHLYLSSTGLARCEELLEHCSAWVAQQGGHRLFLRVPEKSPLIEPARRCGFLPCFSEEAYQGTGLKGESKEAPSLGLRAKETADDYSLFRLYNASTPPQVRWIYGLTLDEWRDASESLWRRGSGQWVLQRNGSLGMWLSLAARRGRVAAAVMVNPDEKGLIPQAVDFLREKGGAKAQLQWLAPDYLPELRQALAQAGFVSQGRYLVLVKPAMARVKATSLAAVGV